MQRLLLQLTPDVVGNGAAAVSQAISETWSQVWQISVHGALFQEVSRLALGLAGILIAIYVVSIAKEFAEDEGRKIINLDKVLPLVLVILMLSGGGAGAAKLCDLVRFAWNATNTQALNAINAQVNIEHQLDVLSQYQKFNGQTAGLATECNNIVRNDQRTRCLENAEKQAQALMGQINLGDMAANWQKEFQDVLAKTIQNPLQEAQDLAGKAALAVLQTIESPFLLLAQLVLMASHGAAQYLGEIAFTLTACIAPLAIVGIMLPNGMRLFYTWISGFVAIGLYKFCLNILTGLVATYTYYGGAADIFAVSIVLGLFAPLLAAGMAAGGGFGIYNGIIAGVRTVVSIFNQFNNPGPVR